MVNNLNLQPRFILLTCMVLAAMFLCTRSYAQELKNGTINRKAVVQRHNIKITNINEAGPSQVGNGNFAYSFDITGLQTINPKFATMSNWSWHSTIPPSDPSTFIKSERLTNGKMVSYDLPNPAQKALSRWIEGNPHKFNLGRIGLFLKTNNGGELKAEDIKDAVQYFDLWTGTAESTFKINGHQVKVTTVGHAQKDIIAFKIESELVEMGLLGVFMEFPYADLESVGNGSDYNSVDRHHTEQVDVKKNLSIFNRTLDSTTYQAIFSWTGGGAISSPKPHRYVFLPNRGSSVISYVYAFSPTVNSKPSLPKFASVIKNTQDYWPSFWKSGGAIDFSRSKDERWFELERRVVLSQYLVKINSSGKYPPQESGLVANSWYGRFHYEMIWWNQAHFALWGRWSLLNESLKVYSDNLQSSIERAQRQGYQGARYPKCTGPDGREWPHPIHAFLVWQQPHPIFFADLDYRAHPTKATLRKWKNVVENSADFLASFAKLDTPSNRYVLGNPISAVSENNDFYKDRNPAFELGYWRYGLKTAQFQRSKLGLPEKESWNTVAENLAPIPMKDGYYEQWEGIDDMWGKYNYEHPALLGIFGMLPGDGVDTTVMRRTYDKVKSTWKFNNCWGWDFPLVAMTAARIGRQADAIDMLLYNSHHNTFEIHGMAAEGKPYFPYMPANGGLLYTIAMMCAGWDGAPNIDNPGFPNDGSWVVRWENLSKAP